jgi:hypothetical protein
MLSEKPKKRVPRLHNQGTAGRLAGSTVSECPQILPDVKIQSNDSAQAGFEQ